MSATPNLKATNPFAVIKDPDTLALFHFNGGGSTYGIFDEVSHRILRHRGTTSMLTSDQYKFAPTSFYTGNHATNGGGIILLDGMLAYLPVSRYFTIEMFFRLETLPSNATRTIIAANFGQSSNSGWWIQFIDAGGTQSFKFTYNGGNKTVTLATPLVAGQWYHFALVVGYSVIKFYVDGVYVGGATGFDPGDANLFQITYATSTMTLGNRLNGSTWQSECLIAWIDELRISTKPRWSGDFTPPSSPYSLYL